MQWHNLKTLATEAWREVSTYLGAGGAFALAAFFPAEQLNEWNGRLMAGAAVVACIGLILNRARKGGE